MKKKQIFWYDRRVGMEYKRVESLSADLWCVGQNVKRKKLNFWQATLKTPAMFRLTFLFVWQPFSFSRDLSFYPVVIFSFTGSLETLKQMLSNLPIT